MDVMHGVSCGEPDASTCSARSWATQLADCWDYWAFCCFLNRRYSARTAAMSSSHALMKSRMRRRALSEKHGYWVPPNRKA